METSIRSTKFTKRDANRYWWFHVEGGNYVPPLYSFLTDQEWEIMEEWYNETDEKTLASECNVSMMSVIQGFIMGNPIKRILQFGTSVGYSALLIGFMMRHMNAKHHFVTVDVDEKAHEFSKKYIEKANLEEYVEVITDTSSNELLPEQCIKFLGGLPQIIIIDSSHNYQQTIKELNLWYNNVAHNGFIFLHDTSLKAKKYDGDDEGGVERAVTEWTSKNETSFININKNISGPATKDEVVYLDGCGLGIIQKI
jgi:predicted O-methyltransferase YrrM